MPKEFFKGFTVLSWIVFAALQYNDPDPYLWMPAYLSVSFLYASSWVSLFRSPVWERRLRIFSLSLAAVFLAWGITTFLVNPIADFDSETFRESLGLTLSSIWCLIYPLLAKTKKGN
ncbi:hypothetical protein CH373_03285 [Leptospira perolatii]|uniref:Uncharacterized protein n=2 Tax=Leptospira perolatii TaxID=2023191 RepID=A0A2M9ZTC0_9LEPT|nr:hypothetical protein CH360_03280 [Leptospira perolatii]PJZ75231.1 hypothetical protein CH373_03285 [Leptospira perolatii]